MRSNEPSSSQHLMANFNKALDGLKDFVFPAECPGCRSVIKSGDFFCKDCLEEINLIPEPVCPECGLSLEPGSHPGDECTRLKGMAFDRARSMAFYGGPLAEALTGFKYRRNWPAGSVLAAWFGRWSRELDLSSWDILAPVPLHYLRLLKRGFNQAMMFIKPLEKLHGIKAEPRLLSRVRHTRPQVRLAPMERRANVSGAFKVNRKYEAGLKNLNIILVDDVFTTGSTAHECASVLKKAGADKVMILTLARALGRMDLTAREMPDYEGKDAQTKAKA